MEKRDSLWTMVLKYVEIDLDDSILYEEDHSEVDLIEDLGLDSMRIMALIVEIEDTYAIEIDDEYLSFEVIRLFGRLKEIVKKMEGEQGEKKYL